MWRFGRYSERKKRKSPFTTTPLSFDAPCLANPTNIQISLTLLETRIPGLQFCCWQYIGSSSNVRTVLSESQKRQFKTDFNAKWAFNVIYFSVIEEPLWDYIVTSVPGWAPTTAVSTVSLPLVSLIWDGDHWRSVWCVYSCWWTASDADGSSWSVSGVWLCRSRAAAIQTTSQLRLQRRGS